MPEDIRESTALRVREAKSGRSGRLQIGVITPGWGSSGYYSPEVLEAAGTQRVFPAGTQMFIDHPSESEEYDRPERSVRDLAAVLTEDATWDGGQLVAEAQVFGPYVDMLTDQELAKNIGVSIRASAAMETGEAEGRRGRIITQLVEAQSVDFVTKAGRGGRILSVLESARTRVVERACRHDGVNEATANDTREGLENAVKDAYGAEQTWLWVRDFDDTTVWFEVNTPDSSGTYSQAYSVDDLGVATLTGDRTEVKARTEYVPISTSGESAATDVSAPAGQSTATESEETNMATIQIEEAELGRLRQDAERVQTLESERDAARQELEEARTAAAAAAGGAAPAAPAANPAGSPRQVLEARITGLTAEVAQMAARERARDIINEELAEAWVATSTVARLHTELIADLPIVENALDEQALRTRCVEARDRAELEAAETLTAAGVGTPRGLGAMTRPAGGDTAKYGDSLKESFKELGLSEAATETAVKGR